MNRNWSRKHIQVKKKIFFINKNKCIFSIFRSIQYLDKSSINYGSLLKTFLFKSRLQNATNISTILRAPQLNPILYSKTGNFSVEISNLNYVITVPPFLIGNITATYTSISTSSSVITNSVIKQNSENGSIIKDGKWKNSTFRPSCPDISQYLCKSFFNI